jgi:hypothetical protein
MGRPYRILSTPGKQHDRHSDLCGVGAGPGGRALVGRNAEGDIVKEEGEGRLLSGLAIDLETRKRVKLAGRMVAGSLNSTDEDYPTNTDIRQGVLQLVARIDESLGGFMPTMGEAMN